MNKPKKTFTKTVSDNVGKLTNLAEFNAAAKTIRRNYLHDDFADHNFRISRDENYEYTFEYEVPYTNTKYAAEMRLYELWLEEELKKVKEER